jgi:hypothetical protein
MASAGKFRISKTRRIRSYFRRLADGECDDIDRFRKHVRAGSTKRKRALEKRAQSLPPEIQELLAEDLWELDRISCLADQLSIVGLYRIAEIDTARMLGHGFGKAAMRNASSVDNLKKFLKQKNVALASVPHFRAIDELRLLNNAVKHDGRVTKQLSQKYRGWREGEKLEGLDKAYDRLRPKVPVYIFRLAQRLKLRYK